VSNMADKKDRDVDRDMDELLTKALAGPAADPSFRAQLRRRVMEQHPATELEQPEKGRMKAMTTVNKRKSRPLWRVGALVASVAVIALVAVRLIAPAPGPVAEFGVLPGLAGGLPAPGGGAGGPGYTFEFTYGLGGQLATVLPKLQDRELVHKLVAPEFTEARVGAIATKLGITATVVREGWQDGYLLAADPGDGGASLRMFPGGYTAYMQPYDAQVLPRTSLPGDARAVEIARNWLVTNGFVPAGELGAGTVTEDLEIGSLFVRFKPVEPTDVVSIAPFAIVQISEGEKIAYGAATWFPAAATSAYPLRPVSEAWQEVAAGQGILEWHLVEFDGPGVDENNVVAGQATADRVRVAWFLTSEADKTPFLVPVYVFSGQVVVAGDDGPTSVPFQVWAPAVTAQYTK
jgi:hypothetical protein